MFFHITFIHNYLQHRKQQPYACFAINKNSTDDTFEKPPIMVTFGKCKIKVYILYLCVKIQEDVNMCR